MKEEIQKLKPVVFINGNYNINYYNQNTLLQGMILKAMMESDDPQEWKRKAGLKTMGRLERELDKMSRHKEYCKVLEEKGVNLEWIVNGIKDVAVSSKPAIRLKAYQTVMRSLGIERFEEDGDKNMGGWEDVLMDMNDNNQTQLSIQPPKYEVNYPEIPEGECDVIEREERIGKDLYE